MPAPPAAAAYDLPFEVDDSAAARRLAGIVERRLAGIYAQLAAALDEESSRKDAVLAARECATRSVAWGADPVAFPG